jgi:hypothetical protein
MTTDKQTFAIVGARLAGAKDQALIASVRPLTDLIPDATPVAS